jgi:hypothetical protein
MLGQTGDAVAARRRRRKVQNRQNARGTPESDLAVGKWFSR